MPFCKNCNQSFVVPHRDKDMYGRLKVKEPTHCFDCRVQRKFAFRNERTLYNRKCDKCYKDIISMYSADAVFPVYCPDCWHSDKWDATDYGINVNFAQPFFEQLSELQKKVPRVSVVEVYNENCEYTSWVDGSKNCYLLYSSSNCENTHYSELCVDCKDSLDCTNVKHSENCYFCLDVSNSYNIKFSKNVKDSFDCDFCFDLVNCNNCLLSFNLRHKKYCINNVEYSPDVYKKKRDKILSSRTYFEKAWEDYLGMIKYDAIHKYAQLVKSEQCNGDYLTACDKSYNSYDSSHLQSCNNVIYGENIKDCIDCYAIVNNSELCCETFSTFNGNDSQFSIGVWESRGIKYSDVCQFCHDCFGCISLRHRKNCILNKQYTEHDYQHTVDKIISHMKKTEYDNQNNIEFGEFFPVSLSPFAYNETIASEYYTLDKHEILAKGWGWREDLPHATGGETLETKDVPEEVKAVQNDMTEQVLACKECNRNYKIIKQELEFYKKNNLPIPVICSECRHKERIKLRIKLSDGFGKS